MAVQDDLLSIAHQYLNGVKMSGNENITAKCPFHRRGGQEERHASFCLSVTKGVWHCFSCHESGNLPQLLRLIGISYQVISTRYQGVIDALRQQQPMDFDRDPIKPRIYADDPLPEAILGIFDKCPVALVDPAVAAALDPEDPVVFTEETLRHFEVGFDDKHMRITFPLRDLQGGIVGVSGRTVTGAFPRYKVYDTEYKAFDLPAREMTRKSMVLWNAHVVYPRIFFSTAPSEVLVVEGFKGAMWAWEAGIKNVVALLGSNISFFQKWVLERMGCTACLMLDNDDAGQSAQKKIIEELHKSVDLKIVTYSKKQPTRCTADELRDAVGNAENYFIWSTKNKEIKHGLQ